MYPQIHARQPGTLRVHGGALVKTPDRTQSRSSGDQLHPGVAGARAVVYKIGITCSDDRYNVGLGCYVGDDDDAASRIRTRFCFHPGMHGGQCRVEGREYLGNRNIGFTPPMWNAVEANPRGQRGTKFTVRLSVTGEHSLELEHPTDPSMKYSVDWRDEALWTDDMETSPSFGIYAGDIRSSGSVFYENFSLEVQR